MRSAPCALQPLPAAGRPARRAGRGLGRGQHGARPRRSGAARPGGHRAGQRADPPRAGRTVGYHRHQGLAYSYGGQLVDLLLRRFGPERFLRSTPRAPNPRSRRTAGASSVATSTPSTPSSGPRSIGGSRRSARSSDTGSTPPAAPSVRRRRMEELPHRVFRGGRADARPAPPRPLDRGRAPIGRRRGGRAETFAFEEQSLRSGDFAACGIGPPASSWPTLAICADRSRRPDTRRIGRGGSTTSSTRTPRVAPACPLPHRHPRRGRRPERLRPRRPLPGDRGLVRPEARRRGVRGFRDDGRPRVPVRIEDLLLADQPVDWRASTCVLAEDDLYAVLSEGTEGGRGASGTSQSEFTYDRHEGVPSCDRGGPRRPPPTAPTRRST